MNQDEIIAMAIDVSVADDGWEFCFSKAALLKFVQQIASKDSDGCDKWRQAIDHEMVVAHLGVAKPEDDPAALLHKIIQWHVDVALDPAVSASARALIEKERTAVLKLIEELDEPPYRGYESPNTWDDALIALSALIRARGQKEGV